MKFLFADFACFEYLGDAPPELPSGLELRTLIGGRYAVFIHHGSYRTLRQSWNRVYRDWLPASGRCLRDAPPFEIYVVDPRVTRDPEKWITEIHLPVE